jgi:thiol-disulfide isomerase/thioredoxin
MLKTARRRVAAAIVVVAALAALGGLAVLYGNGDADGKLEAACPRSGAVAARLGPLAHGEVAALLVDNRPKPAVDIAFVGPDGKPRKLSDWRGRNVLLNLWATWCVPCRKEMPALDRLQAKLGDGGFEVVAVNIDTARLDRPKAFLNEVGVKDLAYYSDASADSFEALRTAGKTVGLPTSLLIDAEGCELGVLGGPAAWDSADAEKVVTAMAGK